MLKKVFMKKRPNEETEEENLKGEKEKCIQKVKDVTAEGGVQCWFRILVKGASWWPLHRHAAALKIDENCTVL